MLDGAGAVAGAACVGDAVVEGAVVEEGIAWVFGAAAAGAVDGVVVDGAVVDGVVVDGVFVVVLLDGCEFAGGGSVVGAGRVVGAGVEPSMASSGRAAIRIGPFGERLSTGSGRFRWSASPSIELRSTVGVAARGDSAPRDLIGEAATNSHATRAVAVIRIAEVMLTQRHPCCSNRIGKPCRRSTLILMVSFGVSNHRRGSAERKTNPEVGEQRSGASHAAEADGEGHNECSAVKIFFDVA